MYKYIYILENTGSHLRDTPDFFLAWLLPVRWLHGLWSMLCSRIVAQWLGMWCQTSGILLKSSATPPRVKCSKPPNPQSTSQFCLSMWGVPYMGAHGGTPLMGFSLVNHPFGGNHIYRNPHVWFNGSSREMGSVLPNMVPRWTSQWLSQSQPPLGRIPMFADWNPHRNHSWIPTDLNVSHCQS